MTDKRKTEKRPTIITIRLTDETGEVAHKATLTVTRGDLGHVRQFEYFDAHHVTEAIEAGLTKLDALERQPPQIGTEGDADASPADTDPTEEPANMTPATPPEQVSVSEAAGPVEKTTPDDEPDTVPEAQANLL